MPDITEDDIYRSSTQYRLWSFTKESLASLRSTTNATAAEGVRTAIGSLHAQKKKDATGNREDHDTQSQLSSAPKVDCLTVDEEQALVGYYCLKAMQFADFYPLPTNVKATAVQYLKRFYLSNSPMTYHPKELVPTAVFLATKTENCYTALKDFASKLPKATPEDVIAPEFLLTQGLRFTFDVRHPYRGLEGGYMELLAIVNGSGEGEPGSDVSPSQLQKQMLSVPAVNGRSKTHMTVEEVTKRTEKAKSRAQELLKTSALFTDAYFLYTPSQIWLSAFFLADEPLTRFYVDLKLPALSTFKTKLVTLLQSCAVVLRSSPSANPGEEEIGKLRKIDKKLYMCRNPEKIDLVGISKAQKREGTADGLDEQVVKKRKLEREKSEKEAEDVFGPALSSKR